MVRRLKNKDYLKPKEVATLLRVEPGTVRLWTQDGRLRATTTAGGHRRFNYHDVERFAREHDIELPVQSGDSQRVLIVDDDKRIARMVKNMLLAKDPDLQIQVVHDGFSAGQAVEKFEPHVIILDLIMPGVDGYQLCKTLKDDPATAGIRIIAITGDPDPKAARKIVKLGAEQCLAKPIKKPLLLEAVGV